MDVAQQWGRIDRRKGLTMQDLQKTLITAAATVIMTMGLNVIYTFPRLEEKYEIVAKSIEAYNISMQNLTGEAVAARLENQKALAEINSRVGVLEYRIGDKRKKEY